MSGDRADAGERLDRAFHDHARALDQLRLLAGELERSYPGEAVSLREAMEETLTLSRLSANRLGPLRVYGRSFSRASTQTRQAQTGIGVGIAPAAPKNSTRSVMHQR